MLKSTLITLMLLICVTTDVRAVVWWDFDDMPVTASNGIPGESANWKYSSVDTPYLTQTFFGSAGFVNKTNYGTLQNESISIYASGYNDPHMGYWSFGYLDIVDDFCMSGKCMRYTITGGHSKSNDGADHCGAFGTGYTCDAYGGVYRTKEQYLSMLSAGINPNYDKSKGDYNIGRMKFYLGNNDNTYKTPMPSIPAETNRMSYYVWNPVGIDPRNVPKDTSVAPGESAMIGPANSVGGHWYHYGTKTMGGGWTHYYVDEHPSYSNSWGSFVNAPGPLGSQRTFRVQYPTAGGYWSTMYNMYHLSGAAGNEPIEWNGATRTFPNTFYVDNIQFLADVEPQNEETINGIALSYNPSDTSFWLGFESKYPLGTVDYGTYEVRYRIGSAITNDNWSTSTLTDIIPIPQFKGTYPAPGVFAKNYSTRTGVMVRFRVQAADQSIIVPGASLWVAVKEVGQNPSNLKLPSSITGYMGRNYEVNTNLDWEYDQYAIPLIKRIPYTVGPFISTANPVCDKSHLNLCTTSELCSMVTPAHYWYNSACNASPQAGNITNTHATLKPTNTHATRKAGNGPVMMIH